MKRSRYLLLILLFFGLLGGTSHAETTAAKPATPSPAAGQQKPAQNELPRLSEEKYKIYKDALNKARNDTIQIREQLKIKRAEASALMSAEKFDKAAFLAKYVEIQALVDKTSQARATAIANTAEQFGPADRKILAERFIKRSSSHRESDWKKQTDDGKTAKK